MLALAVVGPIASGKSLVLATLRELGAATRSADEIAREVTGTDGAAQRRIHAEFGRKYQREDGSLDRKRLADLIFRDDAARERLESILHPLILDRIGSWLQGLRVSADPPSVAAVEVLRLPKGLRAREHFDVVWLCDAPSAVRLGRLMRRDGLKREQALARVEVQERQGISDCDPDLVLDAGGTKEELRTQVLRAWEKLCQQPSPG